MIMNTLFSIGFIGFIIVLVLFMLLFLAVIFDWEKIVSYLIDYKFYPLFVFCDLAFCTIILIAEATL